MSTTTEQVLHAALALPSQDRLDLAEALLDSAEPTDRPPLHEGWHEVLRQRCAELESGAVTPISWEKVERQIDAEETAGG